jgi:hypothetical protein
LTISQQNNSGWPAQPGLSSSTPTTHPALAPALQNTELGSIYPLHFPQLGFNHKELALHQMHPSTSTTTQSTAFSSASPTGEDPQFLQQLQDIIHRNPSMLLYLLSLGNNVTPPVINQYDQGSNITPPTDQTNVPDNFMFLSSPDLVSSTNQRKLHPSSNNIQVTNAKL